MLLTTREVAELLRVHPKHVYRLMRRGLPAGRVGDEWRFDREAVLAWARAREPASRSKGAAGGGGADVRGAEGAAGAPGGAPTDGWAEAPAHLAANGDVAVELLLDAHWRGPGPWVGFVRADHGAGIELLRRRAVLLCGFHETNALPSFDAALARLHVVERDIGVAFAPGRGPRRLAELADGPFATRPPSAGVRSHLDAALRREGVEPAAFGRPATSYASHQDVVLALARGEAEAGLTTRAWAARLGLGFRALASEPYAFLLYARDLERPEVRRLRSLLGSPAMRGALEAAAGYDARRAGDLLA
ncbi:MAG TPA: helix-turn-helix transcriptional regulator [Polyangiaceae bacterium]|nr:helix-turn-helix transcriptional regulator [Polyangiaceae bacterium]